MLKLYLSVNNLYSVCIRVEYMFEIDYFYTFYSETGFLFSSLEDYHTFFLHVNLVLEEFFAQKDLIEIQVTFILLDRKLFVDIVLVKDK